MHCDPQCGILNPGAQITTGAGFSSCSGEFTLTMQGDGNLVLSKTSFDDPKKQAPTWSSRTQGAGAATAVMQEDGNFAIYAEAGVRWSTKTAGNAGAWLELTDEGALVIRKLGTERVTLWSAGTP